MTVNTLFSSIEQLIGFPLFHTTPVARVLFLLILLFVGLLLLMPLVVLVESARHRYVVERRSRLTELYQVQVFDYLISKGTTRPNFGTKPRYRVLLSLMYELSRYTEGEDRRLLLRLFEEYRLDRFVLHQLRSPFCTKRAFYLKRIAYFTSASIPTDLLQRLTRSRSVEQRLHAMQALLLRRPEQMITLFSGYNYPLSKWEQISYYDFLLSHNLLVPDFHSLALSPHPGVATFAIRMVRLFQQKQGSVAGYESLLTHPNLDVQGEMFLTLVEFGYEDLNHLFSELFGRVPLYMQMHILTFLANKRKDDIPLLMQYYHETDSSDLRLHILACIYNYMEEGPENIARFARQEEDNLLRKLSNHLLNNVV